MSCAFCFWSHFLFDADLVHPSPHCQLIEFGKFYETQQSQIWVWTTGSESFCFHEAKYWPHFHSLTSLLGVEGHQLGVGFDVVPLAGEGTSTDIVDPSLDFKCIESKSERSWWVKKSRIMHIDHTTERKTGIIYSWCFFRPQCNGIWQMRRITSVHLTCANKSRLRRRIQQSNVACVSLY